MWKQVFVTCNVGTRNEGSMFLQLPPASTPAVSAERYSGSTRDGRMLTQLVMIPVTVAC